MPNKRLISVTSTPPPFYHYYNTAAWHGPTIVVSGEKVSGSATFDTVMSAIDITPDGIRPISTNQFPTTMGGYYALNYAGAGSPSTVQTPSGTASTQFPSTTIVSIREIQVTFVSGHVEVFDVPICVLPHHAGGQRWFKFNPTGLGSTFPVQMSSVQRQTDLPNTHPNAALDPNTGLPLHNFYSLTPDIGRGGVPPGNGIFPVDTEYCIFTKYSGATYNPGALSESEIFSKLYPSANNAMYISFPSAGGWMYGHSDRIAMNYGIEGFTTFQSTNSGRQELHRIDFVLQENNTRWYDNLETQSGTLMDIPSITQAMDNNLGIMQGTKTTWQNGHWSLLDSSVNTTGIAKGDVWDSLNTNIITWNSARELVTRGHDATSGDNPHYHFTYRIYYAENLTPPPPAITSTSYQVCDTLGDPNYYITTSLDCNGATIPQADLPGGANHANVIFVHSPGCCSGNCSGYTPSVDITCSNKASATTTANDAWIKITHPNNDPSVPSTIANQFSSGSLYTYNLTLSTGASLTQTMPPTGGNTTTAASCVTNVTSGTQHLVTCPASALIAPGMQVSGTGIPAGTVVGNVTAGTIGLNATQFSLEQIYTGAAVQATSAATSTLTFSSGEEMQFANLSPNTAVGVGAGTHYILTITDGNGCIFTTQIQIVNCPDPTGCTDNSALNYDSTAIVDDNSCLLCDADTGKLEDANKNDLGDIFTNHTTIVSDATVNASLVPQSDGTISVTTTLDPALQQYVALGATETYTMAIYPAAISGDPSSVGSVISTQAGIASNTFSYTPQHTFSSLPYGHYAIKVQFVDSNNALEVEECFTWIFDTIKVPVCDLLSSSNYNTTVPSDFRKPDPNLCLMAGKASCPDCGEYIEIIDGTTGGSVIQRCGTSFNTTYATDCNPQIIAHLACSHNAIPPCVGGAGPFSGGMYGSMQTMVWFFNGVPIANQGTQDTNNVNYFAPATLPGSEDVAGYGMGISTTIPPNTSSMSSTAQLSTQTCGACPNISPLQTLGSGLYTLEIHRQMASGAVCVFSMSIPYTQLNDGCLDPTALNYNPNAQCPGPCVYESWDCDPTTNTCSDPGDGTGAYATEQDCIQNCLPPPVSGCTDPCAVNYNPAAGIDDGSCEYKACLDPLATNFQFSCDCGVNIPLATINDTACCIYPCGTAPDVTITTTDASGTCTPGGSNADGCITFLQNNLNGAIHHNVIFYDVNGIEVHNYYNDDTSVNPINNFLANADSFTYCGLKAGVYTAYTKDSLGCENKTSFSIGLNVPGTGCTDPLADNYDPTATCDDGSCIYCGCTDPCAVNYSPTAICDDGSCKYITEPNPCIPKDLDKALLKLKVCLSKKGSEWLSQYKIGTNVDCSTMNKWKLILLEYVLKNKDLNCLFNCADNATPDIEDITTGCTDLWIKGGSYTGINDQAAAGTTITTGEGTTVTDPSLFFAAAPMYKLSIGDVIKMPSGLFWKVINVTINNLDPYTFSVNGLNPETPTGMASGNWAQCTDCNGYITIPSSSVNYYDNFIKFVNKYCADCKIPTAWKQKDEYQ